MKQKRKKQELKQIKCAQCDATITVLKWAPKRQFCEECQRSFKSTSDEVSTVYDNKDEKPVAPVNKFKHAQEILDGLGFVLTSRGYNKQYQDGDAIVRVEPLWDKGTSMDSNYTLEAILVTRQEIIPVIDPNIVSRMPPISQLDIGTLLRELDIKMIGSISQTHIDVIKCAAVSYTHLTLPTKA